MWEPCSFAIVRIAAIVTDHCLHFCVDFQQTGIWARSQPKHGHITFEYPHMVEFQRKRPNPMKRMKGFFETLLIDVVISDEGQVRWIS